MLPAVAALGVVFETRRVTFAEVVKIGRTHLMGATPLTLGQAIRLGGNSLMVHGISRRRCRISPSWLGGTAVGTGPQYPPGVRRAVAARLAARTGLPLLSAPNKFEALAAHDALVFAHGARSRPWPRAS